MADVQVHEGAPAGVADVDDPLRRDAGGQRGLSSGILDPRHCVATQGRQVGRGGPTRGHCAHYEFLAGFLLVSTGSASLTLACDVASSCAPCIRVLCCSCSCTSSPCLSWFPLLQRFPGLVSLIAMFICTDSDESRGGATPMSRSSVRHIAGFSHVHIPDLIVAVCLRRPLHVYAQAFLRVLV